jgi:hypothetical protein
MVVAPLWLDVVLGISTVVVLGCAVAMLWMVWRWPK